MQIIDARPPHWVFISEHANTLALPEGLTEALLVHAHKVPESSQRSHGMTLVMAISLIRERTC